ncbi:MAG: hypothetical protein AAF211_24355 [Myxococcota bacterium]
MDHPPPDIELVELRDAARAAEHAVAHWQERVQKKLHGVRRLAGFFSWLEGTVTGTREEQIDGAVAAVEHARQRLTEALRSRDEALSRLASAEQVRDDRAADDEATAARREALADQVRLSHHPLAQGFNQLETRLDALQLDHDTVQLAFTTGTSLAAALKSTLRGLESLMPRNTNRNERSAPPTLDAGRMQRLESQTRAFEDACATMGLSLSIHLAVPVHDRLGDFVRTWGHSIVTGAMNAMESQRFHDSLEAAVLETEAALAPILERLKAMRAEMDELRLQRDAILDQFDR